MSKPSLSDFMPRPALALKAESPPAQQPKAGKEVKNLTVRTSVPQWVAMMALTTAERIKLQTYIMDLVQADFERRGLRWPD